MADSHVSNHRNYQTRRARKLPNDNSEAKTQSQCFEIESHHIKGYKDF